jgi:hypothetical protein
MDIEQAKEAVYTSLENGNEDIDVHIRELKKAMIQAGEKKAVFDPSRLPQNNRAGRKMMQSYFKKRGVAVVFEE